MYVEWELTMKCNYQCAYCTNLDKSIKHVTDDVVLDHFIRQLGEQYPGVEIFVFGGEPFVHPRIEFIIQCFNKYNIPFVIQTNFSKHSTDVMRTISEPFTVNISIHPTEVDVGTVIEALATKATIRCIDVMYIGTQSIAYYAAIKKLGVGDKLSMIPVTNFDGSTMPDTLLAEYNYLRTTIMSRIINFEQVKRMGRYRSEVWADADFVTMGNPCLYTNRYFLYGPDLTMHNCCYRVNHDGTCAQHKCFLM